MGEELMGERAKIIGEWGRGGSRAGTPGVTCLDAEKFLICIFSHINSYGLKRVIPFPEKLLRGNNQHK